jgi:hypothetical protein
VAPQPSTWHFPLENFTEGWYDWKGEERFDEDFLDDFFREPLEEFEDATDEAADFRDLT